MAGVAGPGRTGGLRAMLGMRGERGASDGGARGLKATVALRAALGGEAAGLRAVTSLETRRTMVPGDLGAVVALGPMVAREGTEGIGGSLQLPQPLAQAQQMLKLWQIL